MKRINILVLLLSILLSSCDSYIGGMDDYNFQYYQLVFINKCSDGLSIIFNNPEWLDQGDTIKLKANNGLWKKKRVIDTGDLPRFDFMKLIFGNDMKICFDSYSSFTYNPCEFGEPRYHLEDNKVQHIVYEFTDEIRDSILSEYNICKIFNFKLFDYPTRPVDSLLIPGSSEAYLHSLFPVREIRDKLTLGTAIYDEAESIDKIRFAQHLNFKPDSLERNNLSYWSTYQNRCNPYYDIDNLRKASLAQFGCDFATLTGRASAEMEKFSGTAVVRPYFSYSESFSDVDVPLDLAEEVVYVSEITYGNIRILLIESDNSHEYVFNRLRTDLEEFESRTDVDYHLITLDENGDFVCTSGGTELLRKFLDESEVPPIHPIEFSITGLSDDNTHSWIHVNDI